MENEKTYRNRDRKRDRERKNERKKLRVEREIGSVLGRGEEGKERGRGREGERGRKRICMRGLIPTEDNNNKYCFHI